MDNPPDDEQRETYSADEFDELLKEYMEKSFAKGFAVGVLRILQWQQEKGEMLWPFPLPQPKGGDWEATFDAADKRFVARPMSQKEIADSTGYTHGYVRQLKMRYDAEHKE